MAESPVPGCEFGPNYLARPGRELSRPESEPGRAQGGFAQIRPQNMAPRGPAAAAQALAALAGVARVS